MCSDIIISFFSIEKNNKQLKEFFRLNSDFGKTNIEVSIVEQCCNIQIQVHGLNVETGDIERLFIHQQLYICFMLPDYKCTSFFNVVF